MERGEFLQRLRDRLAAPPPENLPHPLGRFEEVPNVRYLRSLDDPVRAFSEAAAALGVEVRLLRTPGDLNALLAEMVRTHEVKTAVLSNDPETEGIAPQLLALGVDVVSFDSIESARRADLGVTGAAWGIAATGTLVMHPDRAGGRSVSLLPPTHLALVHAERILREAGELFRQMEARFIEGPPSQLILASGPSRSADIELELTVGVHGPGHVWIGILD